MNTINIKDNIKKYGDIVNTELENNNINKINDTVSNNLKLMNEINSRCKTIILHNVKEIIHDNKKLSDTMKNLKQYLIYLNQYRLLKL